MVDSLRTWESLRVKAANPCFTITQEQFQWKVAVRLQATPLAQGEGNGKTTCVGQCAVGKLACEACLAVANDYTLITSANFFSLYVDFLELLYKRNFESVHQIADHRAVMACRNYMKNSRCKHCL